MYVSEDYLEYNELKLSDIIGVYPILGCLSYEVLLATPSCAVACYRMAPRPYQVIELRKLDNECIVIIFEERFRFQSCGKHRLEMPFSLFLIRSAYLDAFCHNSIG